MTDKKPIQVYLSPQERKAVDKAAKSTGLKTSQYMKMKSLEGLTIEEENEKQLKFDFKDQ